MKFYFQPEDSLYKIFKTLEKIPKWKTVEINIDSHHSLFDNDWRGKQIKQAIDKRNINAAFSTRNEKSRKFFEKIGLKTNHTDSNKFLKVFRMVYLFFFDIKKFHLDTLTNRKSYTFFAVFGFEVLFVLLLIYLLYSLILPWAKIKITPSQQIETIIYNFRYYPNSDEDYPRYSRFISIPFYTGSLDYTYNMSMNSANVKYLQNPSEWEIKIINKTEKEYSFVPNTRFVTEDWKLFKTTNWVEIPAGYNWVPGETIIKVVAMDQDDNWIFMWSRWNISQWTTLYVRNLKQSMFLKEIYAIALTNFTWWTMSADGSVSAEDISVLSDKLATYISQQKKNIAEQNFDIKNAILLAFDDTIFSTIKKIEIPHEVWESVAILNWSVDSKISFSYVKRDDLIDAFSSYIQQRPSDKHQLVSINKNSLSFFSDDGISEKDWTFIIPTKIDVIQSYDFDKDVINISDDIKNRIVWLDKESARSYILNFSEISSVDIKTTPARYDNIPKLKSRINISIND